MRLSTALTPRVIACAEELSEYLALPRGCRPEVEALLNEYGISLSVVDKREEGAVLDCSFTGTLTLVQEQAAKALLAHDIGPNPGLDDYQSLRALRRNCNRTTLWPPGVNRFRLLHRPPLNQSTILQELRKTRFFGAAPSPPVRTGAPSRRSAQ